MWLVPYERFLITTNLSIAEVKNRLEESFEDQRTKGIYLKPAEVRSLLDNGFINKRYKKIKEPIISTNPTSITYYFIPVVQGRNSFIPFIKCQAKEYNRTNSTALFFRFRTHPILLIFFVPFLLIATGIGNSKPGYHITNDPVAYLVAVAFYLFFLIMFKYESHKVRKDLKRIFSD